MITATATLPAALAANHNHYAYGLRLCSQLALPELPLAPAGPADITVQLGVVDLPPPPLPADDDGAAAVLPDGTYLYYYRGVGKYLIRAGRSVTIDPDPDADEPLLRLYLLGPAIGLLLHQRGELALHASAVRIGGAAIAFLGESGEGKSTLAAFLHRRGHDVVTDDVLVVRPDAAGLLLAHPGYAQMKLWPESLEAFGDDPNDLPALHSTFEKRFYRPEGGFAEAAVPLRWIYVLSEDATVGVEPMRPHEALLELVTNTYALRFIGSTGATSGHFRQCAALVAAAPIRHLRRPYSLDYLAAVADLVEQLAVHGQAVDAMEAAL